MKDRATFVREVVESRRLPDDIVIRLLTRTVRAVSDRQLGDGTISFARRRLRRLAEKGSVTLKCALLYPELPLRAPIFSWNAGDPPPHFDRIAWKLKARWKDSPEVTWFAVATDKARLEAGGLLRSRPLRATEVSHDLHVTSLFIHLCYASPERARLWQHEDEIKEAPSGASIVPDAVIGETAIDFGGKYRAAKLRELHRAYAGEGRSYEIW